MCDCRLILVSVQGGSIFQLWFCLNEHCVQTASCPEGILILLFKIKHVA